MVVNFFKRVCELDLEGIVGKRRDFDVSRYRETIPGLDQNQKSELQPKGRVSGNVR
jgi:hypothetical protein